MLAWVEKLTDIDNDLQDEFEQLKQEAAQLRKTRKREYVGRCDDEETRGAVCHRS